MDRLVAIATKRVQRREIRSERGISSAGALVAGFLPQATGINGASSVVGFLQNHLWWYTGGLAILSILIIGQQGRGTYVAERSGQ